MVRLPYRPTLSEALKAGILAMVAAASGTKRCQMEAGGLVPLINSVRLNNCSWTKIVDVEGRLK